MLRTTLIAFIVLLIPASAFAASTATLSTGRTLLIATSTPGNAYALGGSVVVSGTTGADLTALGGSVVVTAPVKAAALLAGGSVETQGTVGGSVRAIAGTVTIGAPVGGDLAAIAWNLTANALVKGSALVLAGSANLADGAQGPVLVYGNTVRLAGDFAGDVRVVSTGRVIVAPGTKIAGTFSYDAPTEAAIPADAQIHAVAYGGSSAVSSPGEARALALIGVGVFLFARILGALILAGLLAGLFPAFAEAVAARAYESRLRGFFLTALLGFAALVATPVLLIILSLTFIGLGIALLIGIAYALLALLSCVYAGIVLGSVLARRFAQRRVVYWRDGALGMLALSILFLIPILGPLVVACLVFFAAGALLTLFFHFAFPHEHHG